MWAVSVMLQSLPKPFLQPRSRLSFLQYPSRMGASRASDHMRSTISWKQWYNNVMRSMKSYCHWAVTMQEQTHKQLYPLHLVQVADVTRSHISQNTHVQPFHCAPHTSWWTELACSRLETKSTMLFGLHDQYVPNLSCQFAWIHDSSHNSTMSKLGALHTSS